MNIKLRPVAFKDGKYGFTNQAGETVIPPIYDYAWSFSEELARVDKGGKLGYIDKREERVRRSYPY